MKFEKGRFSLVHSEQEEGDEETASFDFNGFVLTNDDGSYTIKGSFTISLKFDKGKVPLVMVFDFDMLRSFNTD